MVEKESIDFCIFIAALCIFVALVVYIFVTKYRQRKAEQQAHSRYQLHCLLNKYRQGQGSHFL